MSITRDQLKLYRDVIVMWVARYDTMTIANHTGLPEQLVARWTANYQDLMHEVAA